MSVDTFCHLLGYIRHNSIIRLYSEVIYRWLITNDNIVERRQFKGYVESPVATFEGALNNIDIAFNRLMNVHSVLLS